MNSRARNRRPARLGDLKNHCVTGKVRYRDHAEAIQFLHGFQNSRILGLEATGASSHNEKRTYKCPHCKGWHASSQEKRGSGKGRA